MFKYTHATTGVNVSYVRLAVGCLARRLVRMLFPFLAHPQAGLPCRCRAQIQQEHARATREGSSSDQWKDDQLKRSVSIVHQDDSFFICRDRFGSQSQGHLSRATSCPQGIGNGLLNLAFHDLLRCHRHHTAVRLRMSSPSQNGYGGVWSWA